MDYLFTNWLLVAWNISLLILVNAWLGLGFTFFCLPNWLRVRWWIIAPICGIALQIVVATPLSYFGWGLQSAALPTYAFISIANVLVLSQDWCRLLWRNSKRIFSFEIKQWLLLYIGFITISSFLLGRLGSGSVFDIWGSGDLMCYWTVIDYLWQFGGNYEIYQAQDTFRNVIIESHLLEWSRLGSMVYMSMAANLLFPGAPYLGLNIVLIASTWSGLGIAAMILRRQRVKFLWFFIIFLLHPFLYFPLFFTYLGQAVAVPLLILLLVCLHTLWNPKQSLIQNAGYGVILASLLLSYPMALPSLVLFYSVISLGIFFVDHSRAVLRRLMFHLICGALLSIYYLPHALRELIIVAGKAGMSGWQWKGIIGAPELLGIRSVLGYDLPDLEPMRVFIQVAMALLFTHFTFFGFKKLRDQFFFVTLYVITGILVALVFYKIATGVGQATHGYVKLLSQTALILIIPFFVGVSTTFQTRRQKTYLLPAMILWGIWELVAVFRGANQMAWFPSDLVSTTRNAVGSNHQLAVFSSRGIWNTQQLMGIIRNENDFARFDLGELPDRPIIVLKEKPSRSGSRDFEISSLPSELAIHPDDFSTSVLPSERNVNSDPQSGLVLNPEETDTLRVILHPAGNLLGIDYINDTSPGEIEVRLNGQLAGIHPIEKGEGSLHVLIPDQSDDLNYISIIITQLSGDWYLKQVIKKIYFKTEIKMSHRGLP